MATLEILKFPHQLLRQESEAVHSIDEEILRIIEDMAETMYANKGVGLAAPQVGILKKILVLDIGEGLVSIVNPEIYICEGSVVKEEGCLCLPEVSINVTRHEMVQVKGIDKRGNPVTVDAEGLLARVLQHEIDHLHGTLIIDKVSKLKRDLIIKKFRKLQLKTQK